MLQLRPFRASDADVIVTWAKDEVAFRKWVADRYEKFPIVPADMVAMYSAMDANRFFPMTAFDETGIVGHLILRFPNEARHGSAVRWKCAGLCNDTGTLSVP